MSQLKSKVIQNIVLPNKSNKLQIYILFVYVRNKSKISIASKLQSQIVMRIFDFAFGNKMNVFQFYDAVKHFSLGVDFGI